VLGHFDCDERVTEDVRGRFAMAPGESRDDGPMVDLLEQNEIERPDVRGEFLSRCFR
jgi:hypothetical protein